ncbi:hypothetical protein LTR66_009324 [Elasticomyces elasticus]|nr:hypothetical protein LTR66_009324 [Elasticomyces elasticus]
MEHMKTSSFATLQQKHTKTPSGSTICSYSNDLGDGPVLVLIHGYPQSAYLWRHIIPHVREKISLFVPELPGYGISTPIPPHGRRQVASALLEAMTELFGSSRKFILCGHDRGGRISHRIAVDGHPNLLGIIVLDIVPTLEQWRAFSNPAAAVGYFHWPFLAHKEAPDMIEAYGGDRWCRDALIRIQGTNEKGIELCRSDGAHELYCELFKKREAIVGSCEDYTSAAMPECKDQEEDMAKGKKITVPTLAIYSADLLGKRHDVPGLWRKWVQDDVEMRAVGISDGHGHYLPEGAAEDCTKLILEWIEKLT